MTAILTVTMNPSIDVSASADQVVPVRKLRCTDVRRDPGGGGIVHVVKPNLRELRDLTGLPLDREAEWTRAAAQLVCSGKAEIVALTLGDEGALLVTRDALLHAPAIHVRIASAVGAGDSFLAALVWRLSVGASLEEAFRYGVAAGTAALLTPGTELARKDDTDRLYRQVDLTELPQPDRAQM